MTTHDATPYPSPDEPERIGQLFGEVFDLVDETVDGITDAEVDRALRQVYADGELGQTANLDELAEMLTRTDWKVSSTGPVKLGQDPAELAAWTEVTVARAAASAARAEAQMHIAAAAKARQQAAEVTAGAKAFVDKALDEAKTTKTDAKKEAARLIAEAKQQAEEILAAARASAATAEPSPIAHWATRDLMAGPRLMLITGAAGAGKTWLATELMTRIAEAGEAVSGLAAAQWRDDLIAPLAGLTRFANLLEPAATAFRDIVGHHHGAVRQALTAAYQSSTYPAGSLCRTTVFRYACDDQLEADLDPTFDTPGRCLAPHHGRAADTAHWAELFRTRLSLADWKVPIPFDAIDNCDIDAVAQTGTWVRVADCPDAATFRHLMVQVKRCHADSVALRVSPSITLQSLLLYVTTVGQAEQREAPDVDDLRSALNELPGMQRAGRLALDSGCQTAQGEPGQPTRQDGGRPNHVDALIPEPDTVADRTAIQSRLPAPSLERLVGLLGGPAGLLVRCAECGSSDGRENPALPPHAIVQGVAQRRVGQTVRVVRDELPGVKETDHAGHRT